MIEKNEIKSEEIKNEIKDETKTEKKEKRKYVKADPLAVTYNVWFSLRGFRKDEWFARRTYANRHPHRNTVEQWDEIFKNY